MILFLVQKVLATMIWFKLDLIRFTKQKELIVASTIAYELLSTLFRKLEIPSEFILKE